MQLKSIGGSNISSRRNRNRQYTVLAVDMAVTFRQCRNHHILHTQIVDADCRTDNVHYRINGSHFVEMNLFNRKPMGLGFRLCHNAEHGPGHFLHPLIGIQTVYDMINVVEVPVNVGMRMTVTILMTVLMLMAMATLMTVTILMPVAILMTVLMLMAVTILMAVTFLMTVAFLMTVTFLMPVAFLMTVLMLMAVTILMPVAFLMAVTIFMAMTILMAVAFLTTVAFLMTMLMLLQMHIKIKCIQTAHNLPSKMQMVSIHSQALQRILQHLPVRSQIKQGSHRHIPADARITFQI